MRTGCVFCVMLWACSGCQEPPRPAQSAVVEVVASAPQAQASPQAQAPTAPPASLPPTPLTPAVDGFEVLDAGSEPRTALRLAPKPGQVEALSAGMEMSVALSGPGIPPMAQRTPPIEQYSRIEITKLDGETIETKVVLESVSIAAKQSNADNAAMLGASTEQVAGFEQHKRFSTRGGFLDGNLLLPDGVDPKLGKSLTSLGTTIAGLLITLPEQPVGVGAVWKQSVQFESQGLAIERTTRVELLAHSDQQLTLSLEISEQTSTKTFVRDGMPGEVEVTNFTSHGTGRVTYALDKLVPIRAQSQLKTELGFQIPASEPGQPPRAVDTRVEIIMRIPSSGRL